MKNIAKPRNGALSANDLKQLISEAADDAGSSVRTPAIYGLIDKANADNRDDKFILQLLNACASYINTHLGSASREEASIFLTLLVKTDLVVSSRRVQQALLKCVDSHIDNLSGEIADIAVLLLKTGLGQSHLARWIPQLRKRAKQEPSWRVLDVLLEVVGLVPEKDYSSEGFYSDLARLRDDPDFEFNVDVRRHKWARKLQQFPEEIIPRIRYRTDYSKMKNRMVSKQTGARVPQRNGDAQDAG